MSVRPDAMLFMANFPYRAPISLFELYQDRSLREFFSPNG